MEYKSYFTSVSTVPVKYFPKLGLKFEIKMDSTEQIDGLTEIFQVPVSHYGILGTIPVIKAKCKELGMKFRSKIVVDTAIWQVLPAKILEWVLNYNYRLMGHEKYLEWSKEKGDE